MSCHKVTYSHNRSGLRVSVPIMDFALVLLSTVTLQIPPSTSPSIGPRTEVLVAVPTAAANGYTGFDPASLMLAVEEPQINPSIASLVVSRSGAYGDAVVTWSVSGASIPDIGATGSVVTIAHGMGDPFACVVWGRLCMFTMLACNAT